MPASGGMAGTSVAAPQDCVSAINGNPAAMTQFKGSHMTLRRSESTFDLTQNVAAPGIGVGPFSDKSTVPGSVVPAIGATQELKGFSVPVFVGIGFVGAAGAGTNFVNAPESNGSASYLLMLEAIPSVAIELTDNLSIGGSMFIGDGFSSGPFVGTSKMTNAYSLRGGCGINYATSQRSWIGAYYLSTQEFRFHDQVILFDRHQQPAYHELSTLDFHNKLASDGQASVSWTIAFYSQSMHFILTGTVLPSLVIFTTTPGPQMGAQYSSKRNIKLRCGYALAENPMDTSLITSIDGITPGGIPSVDYIQAQFSVPNVHRISGGAGMEIYPHINLDVFAGGMFPATQTLGGTRVDLVSYWLGFGLTWHFDPCSNRGCSRLPSTCSTF